MSPKEKRKKIDDLILQITTIKAECLNIGLYLTGQKMEEIVRQIGWDLERLIKEGKVDSKQTYGNVAQ